MIIADRMKKNPATATPDMSISDASAKMKAEKIHRLPVLDDEKHLVGVISEKDILLAAPSPASTLSTYEINYLLSRLKVKNIMSRNPVTITKKTTIEEAVKLMVEGDLSCLPVMEDGFLVGIVSKSDLFKILLEMLGDKHPGIRVEALVEDKVGVVSGYRFNMVPPRGLEPPTFRLSAECSNQLSYDGIWWQLTSCRTTYGLLFLYLS